MPMKPEVDILTPCPVQQDCACSTQVIVDGELVIPPQKPEKEQIIRFAVSAEVTHWEVIETPLGPKVIVSGLVHIGISYVANRPEQPVHFAHFEIPWHSFLLCGEPVCGVTACVEFADYTQLDHRHITKMVVLMVCAQRCPCQ